MLHDGDLFRAEATCGGSTAFNAFVREPRQAGPETGLGRLQRGEDVVQIADMLDTAAYRSDDPRRRTLVDVGGGRSYIAVALRKDGTLLGAITAFRQEVRPFTERTNRIAAELCRASGHRDGECTAAHRDARGAGAADRDSRSPPDHQFLARCPYPGLCCDIGKGT